MEEPSPFNTGRYDRPYGREHQPQDPYDLEHQQQNPPAYASAAAASSSSSSRFFAHRSKGPAFAAADARMELLTSLKPRPGSPLADSHTPSLVVVRDRFEHNLEAIHRDIPAGIAVRPHAKAHKSAAIGRMQIQAGACGLCAAKLSEAEVLVRGGCLDVCITNEVVGLANLKRLASLAQTEGATISVCVDSKENVLMMKKVMQEFGIKGLKVLVEVNVGQNRCGVEPGRPAAELAKLVEEQSPWLSFQGLHAYHGSNQHVREPSGREKTIESLVAPGVQSTLDELSGAGLKCAVVTGGGTGSYPFEIKTGLYTEIQPGSYIFMDVDYSKNLQRSDLKPGPAPFVPSLFVLTTVVSVSSQGWAVVDAGTKAVSLDSGPPRVHDMDLQPQDSVEYICGGDEHGILKPLGDTKLSYQVGDLVLLQPGHCDPTVNLYDYFSMVDKEKDGGWNVRDVIDVEARGPGL